LTTIAATGLQLLAMDYYSSSEEYFMYSFTGNLKVTKYVNTGSTHFTNIASLNKSDCTSTDIYAIETLAVSS
jgi:hypothetical protein